MGENLIPAEALRARAQRFAKGAQLDAQGYFGGWIDKAWVTRALIRRGRRFTELIAFQVDKFDNRLFAPPGDETRVLSHSEFQITTHLGPVAMINQVIAYPQPAPQDWLHRQLDQVDVPTVEAFRPLLPMADDLFWGYVGRLGGVITEETIEELLEELRPLPLEAKLAYQLAFDQKLFELDSPGNTVTYRDDPSVVDGEASLVYRAEIIVRGRESYLHHLSEPMVGSAADGTSTPWILFALEDILDGPLPPKKFPIHTGSNPKHWPDAAPFQDPFAEPSDSGFVPGPFSQEVQLASLGMDTRPTGRLYGFVAYATTDSSVREILGCVMASTEAHARAQLSDWLPGKIDHGEQLSGNVLVATSGAAMPARGYPIIEVLRRSNLGTDRFIAQHFPAS